MLVEDSRDELSYRPALELLGCALTTREPGWEEHRAFSNALPNANIHVFSVDAIEPRRHSLFRRWLLADDEHRLVYSALKRSLAPGGFSDRLDYNGGKAGFIYDVYEQAFAADSQHAHDPRPASGVNHRPRRMKSQGLIALGRAFVS